MEDAIVMDKETFKLLASDTRIKILKLLKTRDHNLSEIAKSLNLSKSTIKEHIERLINAGVIKEVDRGKWKYYTLTKYGGKLIGNKDKENENYVRRVVIVLGLFALGLLALFITTNIMFQSNLDLGVPVDQEDLPVFRGEGGTGTQPIIKSQGTKNKDYESSGSSHKPFEATAMDSEEYKQKDNNETMTNNKDNETNNTNIQRTQ
ncbi:winged helix-turn-helix transcriptional regulator [Candidatus Micrarchaeota archaeon]|nr:winged helix-turn-helix transcriptional regulator [Candidatus Micrarchaeota archaeon]